MMKGTNKEQGDDGDVVTAYTVANGRQNNANETIRNRTKLLNLNEKRNILAIYVTLLVIDKQRNLVAYLRLPPAWQNWNKIGTLKEAGTQQWPTSKLTAALFRTFKKYPKEQ